MMNKNNNSVVRKKSYWYKKWTCLSEKDAKRIEGIILPDEIIAYVTSGRAEKDKKKNTSLKDGKLIVTTKRVLFWTPSLFGSRYSLEEYPYDTISNLNYNKGLLTGSIEVYALSNKIEIKNIPKQFVEPATNTIRKYWNVSRSSHNINISNENPLDKIKKLKEFFDAGILTQEEYESKKRDFLEKI